MEKPKSNPPSNLAIIGRYILPSRIFEILENIEPGVGGEIQLTDALIALNREKPILGYEFAGERHDAGDIFGFIEANIAYGLKRPDLKPRIMEMVRRLAE